MEITRDGKTYTLTTEEVAKAHEEFVISFMENELISSFEIDEKAAKDVAVSAYERYCEGNGETEYECIEWAYNEYKIAQKETENIPSYHSKWSEVRNNFVDDNNYCHIDAWETANDDEEGAVIAYVDMSSGNVIYTNPFARRDPLAQEVIQETIKTAKKNVGASDNSSTQNPPMDFIRKLWTQFGDVPMDPETENLEEDWLMFQKGTNREAIWEWFEETFDISVAKDLMHV